MDNSAMRLRILRAIVFATLALATPIAIVARLRADDEKTKPATKSSQLAKDLIGTWAFVGSPGDEAKPPATGFRLKFFTGKHWTVTNADESGKVVYHLGGTYTLDGEEYAETVKYATEINASQIGKTFKFKIKVEGDKYTQVGIDNPYSEVWKRAE
jgi:hypothetical protein